MEIIARIETDFNEKFGIPRQSGLVEELKGRIIFEPKYRNPHAVMGLEEFSHIWLLCSFPGLSGKSGPLRCCPPGWEEIPMWECLPPGPPSGPIPSGSPA